MITRREAIKLASAGAFALAASRAHAAMAGATQPNATAIASAASSDTALDLRRLTTADLRALPRLESPSEIKRTGRTRSFSLVLAAGAVEPLPGHRVQTRTVNGASPGPILRMTEGDDVEITIVNRLNKGTSIHWHGVPVPFLMDGVATFSQAPIAPGSHYVYRWVAPQAGTYMYHSHYSEMEEDSVSGMMIVDPQDASRQPRYDVDVAISVTSLQWEPSRRAEAQAILADAMLMRGMGGESKADPNPGMGDAMERMDMVEYWCFNGKTFPATDPIRVKQGDLVRVRFANVTHMSHPMHLHGHWFRWIAQDGAPLSDPHVMNTIAVDPGQTIDIDFIANNPGVWPLHCHIVSHMVDNKDVMSGLVTAVVYEGFSLPSMMQQYLR
ncbi:MAG: multicopper oxidase domain-containing protein [Candidatus Eremiobacteraeota bacterium]|nr:multicopper oxidase domain-containing protein [Candidatus Eremiobacteraeota bacterium]